MNQFGSLYSQYYDLLYSDKDYIGEVEYVNSLIKENSENTQTILDMGCGTGKHASLLCDKGYKVHGIDLSENMLEIARIRSRNREHLLSFSKSNVIDLELNQKFDAVISLFHVMSYQITNNEIIQAFKVAKNHLNEGGLFIFDFWYGPAVLTDLPATRIKNIENVNIKVTRISEPFMYASKNIVDVNYTVFIEDVKSKNILKKKELHKMRYFFDTELEIICNQVGFKIVNKKKWMSNDKPSFNSWYMVWIVKV